MSRWLISAAVALIGSIQLASPGVAIANQSCVITGSGAQQGVLVRGVCVPVGSDQGGGGGAPQPVTRTVACGTASLDGMHWNTAVCGPNQQSCYGPTRTLVPTFATLVQDPRTKRWSLQSIWCPAATTPGPSPTVIRDQALRLLPRVGIGSAPRTTTLVNIQTIVWAATTANRSLGTVRITGRKVRLRLTMHHATWTFGDATTGTTSGPGTAYDPTRNPCRSAQCPGYYGHIYTTTGSHTITLTIAWHATYSLDGSTWTDVDAAALTGPTATTSITVRQARAVLVPDPH